MLLCSTWFWSAVACFSIPTLISHCLLGEASSSAGLKLGWDSPTMHSEVARRSKAVQATFSISELFSTSHGWGSVVSQSDWQSYQKFASSFHCLHYFVANLSLGMLYPVNTDGYWADIQYAFEAEAKPLAKKIIESSLLIASPSRKIQNGTPKMLLFSVSMRRCEPCALTHDICCINLHWLFLA